MTRRFLVALALTAVATACGADREHARPAPHAAGRAVPTTPAAAPAPTKPPAATADTKADRVVALALARVVRLRKLAATGPVHGKVVSRDEMIDLVKQQLHQEVPAEVLAAQTEELYALGTVPADFDFEQSVLSLMTAQLAGFYVPKTKTMVLGDDLHGVERAATLDHELVHALQDQHYDLEHKLAYRDDASDEQSALHALAEGDATSAMLDAILAPQGRVATDIPDSVISVQVTGSMEIAPSTAGIPDILKRSLIAPYVDGIVLVHWARRRGGWAAVDALWRDPPTTTEQLLHPDKLLAHEAAEVVPVPVPPPGGPARVVYHDVIGEEALRLLFEEWMPERTAITSASGWGGDRLAVFRDGKRFALGWHLRFDDAASARRALDAFARGILGGGAVGPAKAHARAKSGHLCRERAGAGPFAAALLGRDVSLVAGPYERGPDGPRSAGVCSGAAKWAAALVRSGS